MIEKNELISYALDFVSYLVGKGKNINRIILYGFVARGDFDKESDIGLFIDADKYREFRLRWIYLMMCKKDWKRWNKISSGCFRR